MPMKQAHSTITSRIVLASEFGVPSEGRLNPPGMARGMSPSRNGKAMMSRR